MPNAIRANIVSRTHKKKKTTHEHIAHKLQLDAACTRLNKKRTQWPKNDRRHHSCGSNFSRDVNRTTFSQFWELTDMPISNHWTRRANGLHNQTLRLSQSDDHGPKPTCGSHPHAPTRDVEKTCALTRIVFLPPRFSQVANHVLTRTENQKHTKHRSMSCKKVSPPHSAHPGPQPTWWAPCRLPQRWNPPIQMCNNGRSVHSSRIYARRANNLPIMAGGPTTPMLSQLRQ